MARCSLCVGSGAFGWPLQCYSLRPSAESSRRGLGGVDWETKMLLVYYLEQGVSKVELATRFQLSRRPDDPLLDRVRPVEREIGVGAAGQSSCRRATGPPVAQITGVCATKSVEIERCKRGLSRETRRLIKSQSGVSSNNCIPDSCLNISITITYKDRVVGPAGLEPATNGL